MTLHYSDESVELHHGDCLDVLKTLADNSVDAVVTDPPYGLEFMGAEWDGANGFRRSLNEADTGRDSVFGRTSRTSPEYNVGKSANSHAEARVRRADEMGDENKRRYIAASVNAYEAGRPFQIWCQAWAEECLRILKPGGHILAFGGTRTFHRLACAIEDAGFDIRDSLAWVYASGFPKSLDVSRAIDKAAGVEREVIGRHANPAGNKPGGASLNMSVVGMPENADITAPATEAARQWAGWGTALKPSHEPIVVARKPMQIPPADTYECEFNGAECKRCELLQPQADCAHLWPDWWESTTDESAFEPIVVARKPFKGTVAANVQVHGTGALNIDACRIASTDSQLAEKYASVQNAGPRENSVYGKDSRDRAGSAPHAGGRWPPNTIFDEEQAAELDRQSGVTKGRVGMTQHGSGTNAVYGTFNRSEQSLVNDGIPDEGGASRFFPVFKYTPKAGGDERPSVDGVAHPTVKPLEIMKWLVKLVTPPHGLILDPFAGSGTTGEAAIHEHVRAILIEREASYLPLIVARLSKPMEIGFDFG